jgi:protein-arginine kinase activator protein McsA
MTCQICQKNEATVHLTQIQVTDPLHVDLCEASAETHGVNDPQGFSLQSLASLLKDKAGPESRLD